MSLFFLRDCRNFFNRCAVVNRNVAHAFVVPARYLTGIGSCNCIAGRVAGGRGTGIAYNSGVSGLNCSEVIRFVVCFFPLHIGKAQGMSVFRNALWDALHIHFGHTGVFTSSAQIV